MARKLSLLFVLLLSLVASACGRGQDDAPLWADPGSLRFDPDHTRASVLIHNRSGTIRPISDIALDGPDWGSLRFVDESLPRNIPAYDAVRLEFDVSAASFRVDSNAYRSGTANLRFASNQYTHAVPIEFVGTDTPPPWRGLLWTTLALLGLAIGVSWSARERETSHTGLESRSLVAAAFASWLLAAALIPVGFGACRGRLAELVGPRELAQCRAGLGGAEMIGLAADPAIWWWLLALALATVTTTLVRMRSEHALALAGLRVLGLALILASLQLGLAPRDGSATALVLVQTETMELFGLHVPRWGLLAQPLGACLAFLLLPRWPARATGLLGALDRLAALVWAAVFTTVFLAGPSLPYFSQRPVPLLAHGPMLALELLVFAAKLALVLWLVTRLRADDESPSKLARWTLPLAFVQLVAVLLWRLL